MRKDEGHLRDNKQCKPLQLYLCDQLKKVILVVICLKVTNQLNLEGYLLTVHAKPKKGQRLVKVLPVIREEIMKWL